MITERLKLETKANHDETESFSYADKIMNGSLNLNEYKQLIIKNYIFHNVVEQALSAFGHISHLNNLDIAGRMKTASLEADLAELGLNSSDYTTAASVVFNSTEEALGFMYVVEGATLGGSYILKALNRNPGILSQVKSFSYYGVYGETIGAKWKTFQEVLIENVKSKEQEDAVVAAAKKAFDLFRDIFKGSVLAA